MWILKAELKSNSKTFLTTQLSTKKNGRTKEIPTNVKKNSTKVFFYLDKV